MGPLSQCCCCVSLRTGTLVIGVLHLIGSVLSLGGVIRQSIELFIDGNAVLQLILIFAALLILCVLEITIDTFLIVGAEKSKAGYVFPWIVFNIVVLVLGGIGVIVYIVLMSFNTETGYIIVLIIPALAYIVHLVISIYLLMVVYSFYKSIKDVFYYDDQGASKYV